MRRPAILDQPIIFSSDRTSTVAHQKDSMVQVFRLPHAVWSVKHSCSKANCHQPKCGFAHVILGRLHSLTDLPLRDLYASVHQWQMWEIAIAMCGKKIGDSPVGMRLELILASTNQCSKLTQLDWGNAFHGNLEYRLQGKAGRLVSARGRWICSPYSKA